MENKQRKNTRNKVWPETEVHVKFRDKSALNSNSIMSFKAGVDNLGSNGMFIKTEEIVATGTEVELKIDFNPGGRPPIFLHAEGSVVRLEKNGFAVMFTNINVKHLGECIMAKLNAR